MTPADQPLSPEQLDELLNADLDGELARAATDLGLDLTTARAAVDAPAARARRDALQRARDLLAAPPPAADTRTLVATALAAADARSVVQFRPRRSAQVWRVVAGVAATAAVLAGVIAIGSRSTGSGSKADSAASSIGAGAATATSEPSHRAALGVAFGDISDPSALRAAVEARLRSAAKAAPRYAPTASAPETLKTVGGGRAGNFNSASGDAAAVQRPSRANCIASLRQATHLGAPVLSGTGTSAGRPVFVTVFADAHGHLAYVLSATDCAVVSRTPVS